jgi:tetratricopeptide (TPR) repeat protein
MATVQRVQALDKLSKLFLQIALILFCVNVHAQVKSKQEIVIDSLMKINKNAEAIIYLQKEIKLKPNDDMLLRLLGFMHLYTNDLSNAEIDYKKAIALNAKCNRCYLNLSRIYAMQNNADKAIEAIDKSISICDTDASAYAIRASIYELKNDELSALINYDKAIELAPNEAQYYQARALYNKNHNYASLAISDITKAIELDIKNDQYYYLRCEIYYNIGKKIDALDDINIAITMNNKSATYYTARAAIYSSMKLNKQVLDDYNKAIELDAENYFALYNIGGEYYRQEDMDKACEYMNKSLTIINKNKIDAKEKTHILHILDNICDNNKASYYYQRGIAFYNLNKMDDAIKIYNEGEQKFPNNAMLLTFRGNAFIRTKKYLECIKDYEKAILNINNLKEEIKLNNSDVNPVGDSYENEMIASTYSSLAEAYLATGNFDKAYMNINKALAVPNEYVVVGKENYYSLRGEINMANNKMETALKDFDSCLNLNANHVPSLIGKATTLIYKLDKITSKSAGANLKKSDKPITMQWELPLKLNGKIADFTFNEAMVLIQKAIALDENNADAFYIRAVLHYMSFNNKEYCQDITRAKVLGRKITEDFEKICK